MDLHNKIAAMVELEISSSSHPSLFALRFDRSSQAHLQVFNKILKLSPHDLHPPFLPLL
jgi:hypothetical protein